MSGISSAARNEYNIYGTDKRGTGPVPRKRSSQTIHRCYPTFTAKAYFGKASSDKGRGFAWRYKSKIDGCLTDVAGIHIRVSPCYAAKIYDENNNTKDSSGSSQETHNQDWQFNKFFAIYRDKFGNHTSIPLLPRGDNYGNDKTMDDPSKGQYVFRNSDKSVDDDDIGCTRLGSDSHWNRGKYIENDKDLTLDLLIPSTAVVPLNSMFVGFEFSIWIGTYSGMNRDHTFQLSEFCPIPGAVAEKIRGKNPNQYSDGYFTVIPDLTNNVDMNGDRRQQWKKFKPKDYGKATLY